MIIKIEEIDQYDQSVHADLKNFSEFISFDRNELAIVSKNSLFGVIDHSGKVIIPFSYNELFLSTIKNVYSAKQGDFWGFITIANQILIPFEYQLTSDFIEHLCAVKKNDRWGFIDLLNKLIIPLEYDGCTDFSNGYAGVMKNKKWGAIDVKNTLLIPYQYAYLTATPGHYFTVGKTSTIKVNRPDLLAYFPYFLSEDQFLIHFGLINLNNEIVLDFISELPILESFEEQPVVRQNYQQGYLKHNTEFIPFPQFTIDPYEEKILKQLGVMN